MSVQFGKWNFDGKPIDPKELDEVRPVLAPYGPDGEGSICKDNLAILYRAFHTTGESRREHQPYVLPSGSILTWDGRLDNREELLARLKDDRLSEEPTDLEIVARAYERWTTDAFANLIGDWALSVWDPKDQSLILAKDFVGTRHLYYHVGGNQVTWCSILDPLVLFAGRPFKLQEEYIAGWLTFFPAPHLTPYVGIHSVPPSAFVRLTNGTQTISKYWDFDPTQRIRYRTDAEYEEHFRQMFAESVRRRLRSDGPVLAELSGGMDSSSIVCIADDVMAKGRAATERIDTISFYDDSEPNWNERPYFAEVEKKRGRAGCHIDATPARDLKLEFDSGHFLATPASVGPTVKSGVELAACMRSLGTRAVLSGTGGDEVAGGVPNPLPALADSLTTARFRDFAVQLKLWSLQKRLPWFYLLFETAQGFLPPRLVDAFTQQRPPLWLSHSFIKRYRTALTGYRTRMKVPGPPPSFQENLSTLAVLRRQMGCLRLPSEPPCEKRYPYLDRDLLEFLFSIPREQLVRPGQRRSLVRRSLLGIVPEKVLNRKRKAFVASAPVRSLFEARSELISSAHVMVLAACGVVQPNEFLHALDGACSSRIAPGISLVRTVWLEAWLRSLVRGCTNSCLEVSCSNGLQSVPEQALQQTRSSQLEES